MTVEFLKLTAVCESPRIYNIFLQHIFVFILGGILIVTKWVEFFFVKLEKEWQGGKNKYS